MQNIRATIRANTLLQVRSRKRGTRRPQANARHAFTLIELLVVIAVIAILAGILIAVVPQVRRTARKAECASNLRSMGLATQMYAADHNGEIHVPANRTVIEFAGNPAPKRQTPTNHPNRFLNPYLDVPSGPDALAPVAESPLDEGWPADPNLYEAFGNSYIFNYRSPRSVPTLSRPGSNTFKLINVKQPAKTLMIASHPAMNYNGGDREQRWYDGPTDDVYVNACFVDGSVHFIRIPRPGEDNYPDTDEFTWGEGL